MNRPLHAARTDGLLAGVRLNEAIVRKPKSPTSVPGNSKIASMSDGQVGSNPKVRFADKPSSEEATVRIMEILHQPCHPQVRGSKPMTALR